MRLTRDPLRNRSGIKPDSFTVGMEWKRNGMEEESLVQDQVDNLKVGAAPLALDRSLR